MKWYTVVVLSIDIFESIIEDERHFGSHAEARSYAEAMNEAGYIPIIAEL